VTTITSRVNEGQQHTYKGKQMLNKHTIGQSFGHSALLVHTMQ